MENRSTYMCEWLWSTYVMKFTLFMEQKANVLNQHQIYIYTHPLHYLCFDWTTLNTATAISSLVLWEQTALKVIVSFIGTEISAAPTRKACSYSNQHESDSLEKSTYDVTHAIQLYATYSIKNTTGISKFNMLFIYFVEYCTRKETNNEWYYF